MMESVAQVTASRIMFGHSVANHVYLSDLFSYIMFVFSHIVFFSSSEIADFGIQS